MRPPLTSGAIVGLGLVSLLGSACGEESPAEIYCEGLCEQAEKCGPVAPTCAETCISSNPQLQLASLNGAVAAQTCLGASWCGRPDTEIQACIREATEPTPRALELCEDFARRRFECGTWLEAERCVQSYSSWSDAVLDQFSQCLTHECEEILACFNGVVDRP